MKLNLTPMQILGILIIVNGAMIGGTTQLTNIFGDHATTIIVSIAALGNSIFGGLITLFSGQGAQVQQVLAMPGVEKIDVNGRASAVLAKLAVDPNVNKIAPTPAAMADVTATAKAAS